MPIYNFGINTDRVAEGDLFSLVKEDHRTESEQRHTAIALHDSTSNDLQTARKLADEMINVSGAEVKVFLRTDNADFDDVWDADSDPTYWDVVLIKAFFKPQPLETELKKWGADTPNKTEVVFSHRMLYTLFSDRMLRAGDVIQLPYNAATRNFSPRNYRVNNGTPSGNFRYNWLYFTCQVETLTADITVRPPGDTPMAEDEMMKPGGVFRDSL